MDMLFNREPFEEGVCKERTAFLWKLTSASDPEIVKSLVSPAQCICISPSSTCADNER